MKVMISFIGLLAVLAGVLPFATTFGLLPVKYTSGMIYAAIVLVIGLVGIAYGLFGGMSLMGAEKFMVIMLGILTILGGLLPLLGEMMSLPIPTNGVIYSGLIIVVGLIGIIYGAKQM